MNQVNRQMERILDEAEGPRVEVIVQMGADRTADHLKLARSAGEALARRRLSVTPRDLLPPVHDRTDPKVPEPASIRGLMGKATREALALAEIQTIGESSFRPLERSGLVGEVLARMIRPKRKSGKNLPRPRPFWTSRSMVLAMDRDELALLVKEVPEIRSMSVNRRLALPPTMEARQHALESSDLLSS